LLYLFENGEFPGYCLKSKPMIGPKGPFFVLEFAPENPMLPLNMIPVPEVRKKIVCTLDSYHKDMIKHIANKAGCSQDMLIRSMLVFSLSMLVDALK